MLATGLDFFTPAASPRILDTAGYPATLWAKQRNAALDALFYDVGNLTAAESDFLLRETNREGSILIVWPSCMKGSLGVRKFDDYETLRAAPGALLARFAIAGVGSSDVGAAAFARTLADRYQEPVGAIVAGYGIADLLAEAMGGWFVLGTANRLMKAYHDGLGKTGELARDLQTQSKRLSATQARSATETVVGSSDSGTLLRLLLDDDRSIASIAGHSKGSLSIAYALNGLTLTKDKTAVEKAKQTRIVTAGAVVEFPQGYTNVGQYLGALDWFGTMNSRRDVPHETVPLAWHHLNTSLPMHMDFAAVLAHEPD